MVSQIIWDVSPEAGISATDDLPDPGAVGGDSSGHRRLKDVCAVFGAERQDPIHLTFATHQGPSRVTLQKVRDIHTSQPLRLQLGSWRLGGAGASCKLHVPSCLFASSFPFSSLLCTPGPLLWAQMTNLCYCTLNHSSLAS